MQISLPFAQEKRPAIQREHIYQCGLYPMLPKPLQEVSQGNVHLLEYLHMVPVEEVGIPQYYPKLSGKLRDTKQRNLVYPVSDNMFIHIYSDAEDGRDLYIAVEPHITQNLDGIMLEIEKRLMNFTDEFANVETEEERKQILLNCINKICIAENGRKSIKGLLGHLFARRNHNGGGNHNGERNHNGRRNHNGKVHVTPYELEGIKYLAVRDKVGLGVLEPMMRDPYIEDISCSGLGRIFIEHKIFKGLKTAVTFSAFDELDDFVLRLAEKVKKPITLRHPIVDATLADGSRINIVYGKDVSKRGSNFSIRKFTQIPLSILELIEFGSLDYLMAAYLSLVIEAQMNIFITGETASGKTTLLNAVTTFASPDGKIVSIEGTPELQVPHKNWVREVAKESEPGEIISGATMFDLLKAALRQRPDLIIVGEIRGYEGSIAFQAMQTGHAVMSTFHAGSVQKVIQRLTGDPINVPKAYIDNLNVVVIQNSVKLPNGKMGRRATSISEIIGYDSQSDSFNFVEVFRWNAPEDKFEFVGRMNSYLLEQRVAPKRGISNQNKRQIYAELERRARILEKLHKEMGVTNFYELLQVLATAQREGVF